MSGGNTPPRVFEPLRVKGLAPVSFFAYFLRQAVGRGLAPAVACGAMTRYKVSAVIKAGGDRAPPLRNINNITQIKKQQMLIPHLLFLFAANRFFVYGYLTVFSLIFLNAKLGKILKLGVKRAFVILGNV